MKAALLLLASLTTSSVAGTVTAYTDRATFNAAAGVPLTVEDFTETFHFPITTGILNSETKLHGFEFGAPPILPGDIEAGATYSTVIGTGNFFNIDISGMHEGGLLDSLLGDGPLTIDFTGTDPSVPRSVSAFGFDLGGIGGGTTGTSVTISFESGPDQEFIVPYDWLAVNFFGFISDATDITSVEIININPKPFIIFDLDNFTFNAIVPCPADINGDGSLDFFDISAFLTAFGQQDPTADFTGDGQYDFFDISAFLNAYSAGCP